jgi:hypothetical protein
MTTSKVRRARARKQRWFDEARDIANLLWEIGACMANQGDRLGYAAIELGLGLHAFRLAVVWNIVQRKRLRRG